MDGIVIFALIIAAIILCVLIWNAPNQTVECDYEELDRVAKESELNVRYYELQRILEEDK